jgi:hypothetical protein
MEIVNRNGLEGNSYGFSEDDTTRRRQTLKILKQFYI